MQDNIFEDLYDMVPSKIYAIDIETYDIIYMNKFTRNALSGFGTKCYEKVYGYEQPCAFCKIKELQSTDSEFVNFEAFNEVDSKWYNLHEKFVKLPDNRVMKYSTGSDITELKKAQSDYTHTYTQLLLKNKEIEELNENLENRVHEEVSKNLKQAQTLAQQSKMADMGEMIGAIAHQLKQPINVITMAISTVELEKTLGMESNLDDIHGKIARQANFMNDTIDLFRNFFNPNKIKENIYLSDVIKNTLSITNDMLTGIKVIEDIGELTQKVNAYPNELIQVCINILKNAKEFQEENNIKLKVIKISLYEDEEYQIIAINDNAGGIPEDIKEKVFDQYFSTKSEDKGTGIGLNLAKQILEEKHDGKLLVDNITFEYEGTEQTGACFQLCLKKS